MKLIRPDGSWFLFAVPKNKRLETLATILTRLEIPVTLSGWEPTTADTRTHVAAELDLPASTRDAVFTAIPSEEPKLLPVPAMIGAALVAAGPLLIALIAMIGSWVYLGINWSQLDWLERGSILAAGLGGFILAFAYMYYIGQYLEKSILIGVARKALRTRTNPVVDPTDEELFAISTYPRELWTKVISKAADFGFLQVHRGERALVFEGGKERWIIPLTALTAVRIEEAEVGKEGAQSPEIRYYVVLGTYREGEPWEIGMLLARTHFGHDGAEAKRERMGTLFEELRTAIASV